jgi:long-chain acyl-CoA synthetase
VASMIHPLSAPPEIEFFLRESQSTGPSRSTPLPEVPPGARAHPRRAGSSSAASPSTCARSSAWASRSPPDARSPRSPRPRTWCLARADVPPRPARADAGHDPDGLAASSTAAARPAAQGDHALEHELQLPGAADARPAPITPGMSMLAILPMFHGFGPWACACAQSCSPAACACSCRASRRSRWPRSSAASGPASWPASPPSRPLTRCPDFQKADLSCLTAAFAGGDRVPRSIKDRFDEIVRARGGSVVLREGYGLTECVTACMVMPARHYREGSMGGPYPDAAGEGRRPRDLGGAPRGPRARSA